MAEVHVLTEAFFWPDRRSIPEIFELLLQSELGLLLLMVSFWCIIGHCLTSMKLYFWQS